MILARLSITIPVCFAAFLPSKVVCGYGSELVTHGNIQFTFNLILLQPQQILPQCCIEDNDN